MDWILVFLNIALVLSFIPIVCIIAGAIDERKKKRTPPFE